MDSRHVALELDEDGTVKTVKPSVEDARRAMRAFRGPDEDMQKLLAEGSWLIPPESARHYIREESSWRAAKLLREWNYPREITTLELANAKFYMYGTEALTWLMEIDGTPWIQVHAASKPGSRGMVGTPRAMILLEVLAELMGGTRLYAVLPDGIGELSDREKAVTRRYLRIRGWTEDCLGMYTELGG